MATASSVIRRAMRLCGIIDAAEAVPAEQMQDAIEILNRLGQRWLASGLLAAWTDATGPTFSLVTPAKQDDALSYSLALRLGPEFGVAVTPDVAAVAADELRTLWRDRLASTDTTVNGIILRALRIISTHGPLPDTVDFAGSLGTLNALLAEWHVAGIGLPDYSVTGLADTLASDVADRDAVAYQLAIRLAPEYGTELSGLTLRSAEEAMNRLRLRYFVQGTVDFSELPSPNCYGGRFDFESGQ